MIKTYAFFAEITFFLLTLQGIKAACHKLTGTAGGTDEYHPANRRHHVCVYRPRNVTVIGVNSQHQYFMSAI